MKEQLYLFIIHLFNFLFPIHKKKILFISYYGNQYGCNPKYLSQYIVQQNKSWDIVWAFTQPKKYNIKGVRKVRYMSLTYFYELCTCKVLVTNYRMTSLFRKRKKQLYIQTWHSSVRLKKIEKDTESTLPQHYVNMAKVDSKNIDLIISGCDYSTSIFKRSFWYNGEIALTGTPRNDLLFTNSPALKKSIHKQLGIDINTKIVLYAPTFRKKHTLEYYNIKYQELIEVLKYQYGGNWCIAVRLHPHLHNLSTKLLNNEKFVIDVTPYDDIQELLFVSDILISDYSSLIFDFAIIKKPCFLYVPDLDKYINNDRSLYFDINKLPFPICKTNDDLFEKIKSFNENMYSHNVSKFLCSIGSYENGHASERIMNLISKYLK